jgi:hypothetical protein
MPFGRSSLDQSGMILAEKQYQLFEQHDAMQRHVMELEMRA